MRNPVHDLSPRSFEPYGSVINSPRHDSSVPAGFQPTLAVFSLGGMTECEVARCTVTEGPPIRSLERHFRTQEVFVATQDDFILAITPPSDPIDREAQPRAEEVALFRVREGQAVVMERNVWHAVVPAGEAATLLIFFVKHAYPDDWEMKPLAGGEVVAPEEDR